MTLDRGIVVKELLLTYYGWFADVRVGMQDRHEVCMSLWMTSIRCFLCL